MPHIVSVLVPTPKQSHLPDALSYWAENDLCAGTLVKVPLGPREVLGIVWHASTAPHEPKAGARTTDLKWISCVIEGFPALSQGWLELVAFSAQYYQRSLGEVALWGMPPQLKNLSAQQIQKRLERWHQQLSPPLGAKARPATNKRSRACAAQDPVALDTAPQSTPARVLATPPLLSAEQQQALNDIGANPGPFLLFGSTGSGKTEVYLQAIQALFERDSLAQALIMVPEINLTPQLQARVRERFAPLWGEHSIVCLHSGLTPAQRLKSWLAAHFGQARVVLGTRMSIFASIPRLQIIIVDEEHDVSYKQQEGARYSARDLAVYRARLENARVILGSATPSLESWHHSQASTVPGVKPRYQLVAMPSRIGNASLAQVHRVDLNHQPRTFFNATAAAGRRAASTAVPSKSFTNSTARSGATIAAKPSACPKPVRCAPTKTSACWGWAHNNWKNNCKRPCSAWGRNSGGR